MGGGGQGRSEDSGVGAGAWAGGYSMGPCGCHVEITPEASGVVRGTSRGAAGMFQAELMGPCWVCVEGGAGTGRGVRSKWTAAWSLCPEQAALGALRGPLFPLGSWRVWLVRFSRPGTTRPHVSCGFLGMWTDAPSSREVGSVPSRGSGQPKTLAGAGPPGV